jgi:diguanylate cyclase (GGDEF)-like protein/PAS domain S-box-containing protein
MGGMTISLNKSMPSNPLPGKGITVPGQRQVCPHCNHSLILIDKEVAVTGSRQREVCPHCNSSLIITGERKVFHHLASGLRAAKSWVRWQTHKLLHDESSHKTEESAPHSNDLVMGSFGDVSFEDMAKITLDSIGDAVLVVDSDTKVIYLNKVAETMTGWSRKEALGRPVDEVFCIINGTTREPAINPAQRAISEERTVELALGSVLIRHDGIDVAVEDSAAPIRNRQGGIAGAVIVFHDARRSGSVIQEMSHRAQHDFLTGLPNRMLLIERLTQAIGMAKRHQKQIALLFLDLDNFKQINDTLGHAVGDHLLQVVAKEMASCVRGTDTVSRHSGDEFVILLTEIKERKDAAHIAAKVLAKFAALHIIDGYKLQVGLSIGISVYPEDGVDADIMMRSADMAMYSAKKAGRSTYQFCPPAHEQSHATFLYPQLPDL